jgi:hypothetical protein
MHLFYTEEQNPIPDEFFSGGVLVNEWLTSLFQKYNKILNVQQENSPVRKGNCIQAMDHFLFQ